MSVLPILLKFATAYDQFVYSGPEPEAHGGHFQMFDSPAGPQEGQPEVSGRGRAHGHWAGDRGLSLNICILPYRILSPSGKSCRDNYYRHVYVLGLSGHTSRAAKLFFGTFRCCLVAINKSLF